MNPVTGKQGQFQPDSFLEHYRPIGGVPDELLDKNGAVRPVWQPLVSAIGALTNEEWQSRIALGTQYLHDAGVYYRQYSASGVTDREWPLSAIPLVIDEQEWLGISSGLQQRADILEKIAADLYGDNTLVRDGYLPGQLIAQNPEWLRPMVGVTPRSGHFLHFVAFDIGRGPDGNWWVLGDRTQAPSGAAFALENRLATSRIFAGLYSPSNVHRLAGFFRQFRDSLNGLRGEPDSRVGILTPGPMNDIYFEHAYIARYLGFMLLEGEDMTMRDGKLMVRTVDGLKPVSVLWRRMDAKWADPLELEQTSHLGTPGLLQALRSHTVSMVNSLGTGILETRALLAFMPRIAREWANSPLAMPNIATWWCGQERERDHVKKHASQMTIGNAFATRFMFDLDDISVVAGRIDPHVRGPIDNWIDQCGPDLVGQEAVNLSTAPTMEGDRIVPRPMSLRVFLARTTNGWTVMPGGFARIGKSGDSTELAMQSGGSAADVWIVSPAPVKHETMLQSPNAPFTRTQLGILPSRAADNLYWLGRYLERTEHMIRLVRAYHFRVAENDSHNLPLLSDIRDFLKHVDVEGIEQQIPQAVVNAVSSALNAARQVSDRFSSDGSMALADLARTIDKMLPTARPGADMAAAMGILLRKLSGISGLIHENMTRFLAWRFLNIGRSLERAINTTSLISNFATAQSSEGALDLAIEIADSAMTHRRRYDVATNRLTALDLLVLDPLNPRSVSFSLKEIEDHVNHLPGTEDHLPITPVRMRVTNARMSLTVQSPEDLTPDKLVAIADQLAGFSNDLTAAYLR